jgi:hypothetical protein
LNINTLQFQMKLNVKRTECEIVIHDEGDGNVRFTYINLHAEKSEDNDLRNGDKREVRLKWDGVVTCRVKAAARQWCSENLPIAGDMREERRGSYGEGTHHKE